jgi:surfeit locus 1 family protein
MRIGAYRFRPALIPTLVTVLLLPMLVGLGVWQLDRAEQKREILASLEAGEQAPPVMLNARQPPYEQVRHRKVVAVGQYDPGHQFLLENQVRGGQVGYQVLTPLRLAGAGYAVLVDRGWVPADTDRRHLPKLDVDPASRQVSGTVDLGPSVGMRLGAPAEPGDHWPRRLQYLEYGFIAGQLPYPALPYLIRLDSAQADGYLRDWQPVPAMGPATHLGYAFQWFALAVALLTIFVFVNLKREPDAHA